MMEEKAGYTDLTLHNPGDSGLLNSILPNYNLGFAYHMDLSSMKVGQEVLSHMEGSYSGN